jgi:GTP-binding protein LepA
MADQKLIRNFCIIAHIDHGKSTLADRFLELTKTIPKEKMRPQYLDTMDLERGKGITIKMHPVRMCWNVGMLEGWNENDKTFPTSEQSERSNKRSDQTFILNLIDTPGHVDFSYEVSRSLAAVEGAILLVDATQGIQAQTLANFELAKKQGLRIIPAVNKIDLPQARINETKRELADLLNIDPDEVFLISAKYGTNVEKLLEAVIKKIPSPCDKKEKPFRALIFDSKYDPFKGVICYVRVFDGEIENGEKIYLMASKTEGKIKELGYFGPEFLSQQRLSAGEIGYIATGIKETERVRVGDTVTKLKIKNEKLKINGVESLPGYQEPRPMVFASFYPENSNDFEALESALRRLKLNDASLTFQPERKEGLGRGFLCGFLGSLHIEIVAERLKRECAAPPGRASPKGRGLNLIISTPSVVYKIITQKDKEFLVYSPSDWPNPSIIKEIQEPWMKLEIITPPEYLGQVLKIFDSSEAVHIEKKYFGQNRLLLIYEVPLREIIIGFYDKLKCASQGFASMNYEFLEYRPADLVKLDILIAGKKEEAFSKIVPKNRVLEEGRKIVSKLKEILPAQLFSVAIQAVISGKIIARETIKAKGRDVTAPLYGGDYTRKRKLLERQKNGKKRLKEIGEVRIPQNVFFEMFKS